MALKERFTLDAVRRAHHRARTALEVDDHPFADRFEISRKIELGDGLAVAAVGPQRLVGFRDGDAHHLGGFVADDFADLITGFATSGHGRPLRLDLLRRLVLPQPLERGLPDVAAIGPAGELDLGDQLGLQPMHVAGLLRRILAAERALVRRRRLQRRHDAPDDVLPEAGADKADERQMTAAIDAGHQRTEFAVGGLPAAEHDLLPGADLGLGPALGASGAIGRIQLLGDDAFQLQFACRFQHGIAAFFEMLDVADQLFFAIPPLQQLLQAFLALAQRQRAKILTIGEQQIEREEDEVAGLAVRDRRLQRRETGHAVVVERDDFAVDQRIGQRLALLSRWRRTCRSSPALCGSSTRHRHPRSATARDSRRT